MRKRRKCPYCEVHVVNVPRHIHTIHDIEQKQASKVHSNFNTRAQICNKDNPKRRRQRRRRHCAYDGCFATPKNIYSHLIVVHGLDKDTVLYRKCLKESIFSLAEVSQMTDDDITNSQCDDSDSVIVYQKESNVDGNIIKAIKLEASSMGILEQNVYNSEEDEDFVLSDTDHSEESPAEEYISDNEADSSNV